MKRSSTRKPPSTEFPCRVPPAHMAQTKQLIEEDTNSSSSPACSATKEASNSGSANDAALTNPNEEIKLHGPIISNPKLNADDILDGILKDLDSKNNYERTAADDKELDTVSELTGGSAKSLMDEESDGGGNESDSEETSDDDAMAVEQQRSPDACAAVVVTVAEEIKRGATVFSGSNNKVAPASKEEQDMPSKNPEFNQKLNPRVSPDTISFDDSGGSYQNKDTKDAATDGSGTYDDGDSFADTSFEDDTLIDYHSDVSEGNRGITKTNKATMNMDVVIAHPGDPNQLTVRAMYCTPLIGNPDDIVIKVEVSLLAEPDCYASSTSIL
jgi:hypothetical protein